jgi:cysteine desulfurase
VSAGAACHSDAPEDASGVIKAIGATGQQARGAMRISLGYDTTREEIETAARRIVAAQERTRSSAAA